MSLSKPATKYRQYGDAEMRRAVSLIKDEGKTIYFAAKQTGIPWSSLKNYMKREEESTRKMGRPFALTAEMEVKLYNYITAMQELGFGLTVSQVRKSAYEVAKACGRENLLSTSNEIASKWWWASYKKRYGLTLRVPENLSAYRASMANPTMINDFYGKLDNLLTKLGIKDNPGQIWNCDESGLTYVVKPSRVVAVVGKRYVYNRTYAERGQTHTLLACVCADVTWLPPMIIFKGVRWNDNLKRDCLPNTLVKLSPKGWINAELFLEWFQFFIRSIPPKRPAVLLMDSHSSHITCEVLDLAVANEIYLFTFPAHCTHILQPLDVGVFKPLKSNWRDSLNAYMRKNPNDMPNRTNFHSLLNPAYVASFTSKNIQNAFSKTGICPFNNNAVSNDALAPSKLTEKQIPTELTNSTIPSTSAETTRAKNIDSILQIPASAPKKPKLSKARDSSAKCLTPIEKKQRTITKELPGNDKTEKGKVGKDKIKKEKIPKKNQKTTPCDDDWNCGVCKKTYSEDVQAKNGAEWIQCTSCLVAYTLNVFLHQ